jgi:hypothetical protein
VKQKKSSSFNFIATSLAIIITHVMMNDLREFSIHRRAVSVPLATVGEEGIILACAD